jgi:phosphoglycerate kinase
MSLPGIEDLDVTGRRVLVRCDLNVPLKDGVITDDLRITAAVPTLRALLDRGARLVVCSHLGRPEGRVVEDLRLAPVAQRLEQALGAKVEALPVVTGPDALAATMSAADVILLENLRFEPGEMENDPVFAEALAELADAYVNDAFGAAHRAHASVVGVAERLPSAAGLLLQRRYRSSGGCCMRPNDPSWRCSGGPRSPTSWQSSTI